MRKHHPHPSHKSLHTGQDQAQLAREALRYIKLDLRGGGGGRRQPTLSSSLPRKDMGTRRNGGGLSECFVDGNWRERRRRKGCVIPVDFQQTVGRDDRALSAGEIRDDTTLQWAADY